MSKETPAAAHSALPASGGTYVLLGVARDDPTCIRVGRLGILQVQAGWYAYVGSALGPGGLRARLGRHLRVDKPARWHFDYLRPHVEIRRIWYLESSTHCESLWATALSRLDGSAVPLEGFGACDHPGATHLFAFARPPRLLDFLAELDTECGTGSAVCEYSPPVA